MTLKYKPTDTGHDAFEMDGTWNGQAFAINMEGVGVTPTPADHAELAELRQRHDGHGRARRRP